MRYIVLLKSGVWFVEACMSADVSSLARLREAGICGVFEGYQEAEGFVERINSAERHERLSSSGSGLPTN